MKKHELLKHAYDNYPKGTVARFGCKPPDHVSTGRFVITDLNKNGDIQVMSETGVECFFADGNWAEIVKPLLISEDGVPLYYGDEYFSVDLGFNSICLKGKLSKHFDYTKAGFKYFSSESKALEWIEAQKPKSLTVELITLHFNAICTSEKVTIKDLDNEFYLEISKEKLAEINKAMEELQNNLK